MGIFRMEVIKIINKVSLEYSNFWKDPAELLSELLLFFHRKTYKKMKKE